MSPCITASVIISNLLPYTARQISKYCLSPPHSGCSSLVLRRVSKVRGCFLNFLLVGWIFPPSRSG